MSIKFKILAAILVPGLILAFLLFKQIEIVDDKLKASSQVIQLNELINGIGLLVHELQKERGVSSVFINSKGSKFNEELSIQRKAVDKRFLELQQILKQTDFDIKANNLLEKNNELIKILQNKYRSNILALSEVSLITEINANYLNYIALLSKVSLDSKVSNNLIAYTAFLRLKESAGLERAILTGRISERELTLDSFTEWSKLVESQEFYYRVSKELASQEISEILLKMFKGDPFDEVLKLREDVEKSMYEGKVVSYDSVNCYELFTRKIDILKSIELKLSREILSQAEISYFENKRDLGRFYLVSGLSLLIAYGLAWLMHIHISRALKKLTVNVKLLTVGDLEVEPHGIQRNDEIGDIARAMDFFRNSLKEKQSQEVALNSHSLVSITDPKGKILYANDLFCKVSQYSEKELVGKDHRLLNSGKHSKAFMKDMWQTILNGGIWKGTICNKAKDGSLYWVNSTIMAYSNNEGEITQLVSVRTDVSQQIKLEEDIKKSYQEAVKANESKSQFLANMSHEIRTPLNAIIGYADLLKDSELESEQRDMVSTINKSSYTLIELVNDILDLSKIEAGEIELSDDPFDLVETAYEVNEQSRSKLTDKNVELHVVSPENLGLICGDQMRIKQILINLIGNAIKFTNIGEVVTSLELLDETAEAYTLNIAVRDTGIGIAPDKQEHIFEAFKQADGSTTRKYGGTGLGLNITKKFIELMGSEIKLESEEGKGSSFAFTLKIKKAQGLKGPDMPVAQNQGSSVLLIDDNKTSKSIIKSFCEERKIPCSIASADSLKTIENAFSHILVDLFTVMNNEAHLEALKSFAGDKSEIWAVSSDLRSKSLSFVKKNFKGYLLKPFRFEYLEKVILGINAKEKSQKESVPMAIAAADVLMVEDNLTNQKLAKKIISKMGHNVEVANNGQEALDILKNKTFDVIFMDMQMPIMDGVTATQELRKQGRDDIIIALTANAFEQDKELCINAGMNDFTTKPLNRQHINHLIAKYSHKSTIPKNTQRLVLVEDDNTSAEVFSIILSEHFPNIEYKIAKSGIEACSLLGAFRPHYLILDIKLPDIDGLEVLKFLKSDDKHHDVTVLIYSSLDEEDPRFIQALNDSHGKISKLKGKDVIIKELKSFIDN